MDTKTPKTDHNIATLFAKKEDSTLLPRKETTKTPKIKKLACINMMSKVLAKLEKKFSIPMEKRKCAKFLRNTRSIKHLIPSFKPALANPEHCPVYSASKDPDDHKMKSTSYSQDPEYSTFTSKNPFGYRTIQGVVSVPVTPPVKGYIYCPVARRWVLHASFNSVGSRPAGGGCSGTRRGRGKEEKSRTTYLSFSRPCIVVTTCIFCHVGV